jgi:tetratricopeptide (TPR) repeat protein
MRALLAKPIDRKVALFALALFVRLLHLALLYVFAPEIVDHPVLDARYSHRFAQDLLSGTGLANRIFFMNPAYAYLLAAVYTVTGPSPLAAALFQSLFGAGGVVLLHELCRKWWDARTALVAALLLALYRPAMIDAALLETVEMGTFAFLLSVWLIASAEGARARRSLFLAGVVFLWSVLCRGNLILAAPALLLARWLNLSGSWSSKLRGVVPLALGMALVMGVVGLRNRLVGGEWVWLTAYPGQNFFLANHRGNVTGSPHETLPFLRPNPAYEEADFRNEAERLSGRPLTSKEVSKFWFERGLADVTANPGFTTVRFFRKLALGFSAYEIADNYNLAYLTSLTPLRWVPLANFAAIIGLALVGVGLGWKRRRELALLYLPSAMYLFSFGAFFVSSKIRMFLVPFLVAFAAHAAVYLYDSFRQRRFRIVGAAAVAIALVTGASIGLGRSSPMVQVDWSQALNTHAGTLTEAGRKTEARPLREAALALDPDNPFLLINVGIAASEANDHAAAAAFFHRAIQSKPGLAAAHRLYGIALAQTGAFKEAEAELRQSVTLDLDGPESRFNLAVLLVRTGRREEAHRLFEEILSKYPEHAGARQGVALTQ